MSPDESQSTGLIGFLAWVEVNKKRLVIGLAAGVVLICAAVLLIQRQAQKEIYASQALSDVRLPFSAAAAVPPGTTDALLKVAKEHPGTKAAARALLLSGGLLFAEHNPQSYAEAQKRFAQVLQEYPNSPWTAEANVGLAASLAAMGKTSEATAKYEEIRKRFATAPIIDEAKLALARLYEAQKPDEAFRIYDELAKGGMAGMGGTQGGAGGGSAMEANMRMDDLLKQHPELAKLRETLNPPPSLAPAAPPQTITLTNRLNTAASNAVRNLATNVQRISLTNQPAGSGTSAPIQIKLSPQPK
jgi:hypothetical protein